MPPKSTQNLPLILLAFMLIAIAHARKYCKLDGDCESLGEKLICVKGTCGWGICGCPRYKVMRYLGSWKKYGCVPTKRIGERCSTDTDRGFCAADNSECRDGECKCKGGYVSVWWGERCDRENTRFPSETVTAKAGENCVGSTKSLRSGSLSPPFEMFAGVPNFCDCGQATTRRNNYLLSSYFEGGYIPQCSPNRIGVKSDLCITDWDCPTNSKCISNYCQCSEANHVYDYQRSTCKLGLDLGKECPTSTNHCDGSKGLVCGDTCNIQLLKDIAENKKKRKCVCGPGYRTVGASCIERKVGDSCSGNTNCKNDAIGFDGVCHEGKCKNVGQRVCITYSLILFCAMFSRWFV